MTDPILAIACGAARTMRLPAADRRLLTTALRAEGRSCRAIARLLNVALATVLRDLQT